MVNLDELSDEELARQIAAGDSRAFDELHRRYASLLLAVVRAKMRSGAVSSAPDVSQRAWIKVWTTMKTHFQGGNLRGWIMTIATNEAIDELRKVRPKQMPEQHDLAAPAGDGQAAAQQAELRGRALRDCIGDLDEDRRQVVQMWLEQKSHAEISVALGIELGTSMSRLGRAKNLLRQCVEGKLT